MKCQNIASEPSAAATNKLMLCALLVLSALSLWAIPSLAQSTDPASANLWQPGDPGKPMQIRGQVLDSQGKPIGGAIVHVRQADGNGDYHASRYNARLRTREDGSYSFSTVLPGQYYGVKHIHMLVTHDDYQNVETRVIFKGDPNLDESTQVNEAIALDEAKVGDRVVLFGHFDVVLR